MDKLRNLIVAMLFLLSSQIALTQSFMYEGIAGRLTEAQAAEIQKAEDNVKRAEKSIDEAEAMESKYDGLKKSNKEKKREKYDKKTYEAKKLRIDAEKKYLKAYQDVIAVYSAVITESNYYFTEDEEQNRKLNDYAAVLITEAEDKMKEYDKIKNDKGELKKVRSNNLTAAISKARSLKEDALNQQFEALKILLNQDQKKRAEEEDKLAWGNAQESNTILSYQEYIDNFPNGKFVSQAQQSISRLRAEEEKQKQMAMSQQNSGFVFKVQIAASKIPLSKARLRRMYSSTDKIERIYDQSYYKYRVGSFPSYREALGLKNTVISAAPDAFIVVYDKDGKQIEVTDEMKQ